MELSHYLKVFPCTENPEHVILFSTKQASKVRIHKDLFHSLETDVSPSQAEVLEPLGMVTPDREKEILEMTHHLEKRNSNNKAFDFTIVLNLDCNLACVYCFEKDVKQKAYMSPSTAKRLLANLNEKLNRSDKNLLVDFYGGEPLLSLPLLTDLAGQLKDMTHGVGRSFSFRIITNGVLFTRKVAEGLVPLGLTGVKITLDGPPDNHDRFRPFTNGAGSFDVILKNVKATCDLVKIQIGGNYDQANYHRFVELLDILNNAGITSEKVYQIKFDPIFQHSQGGKKSHMGCETANEPWTITAEEHLRRDILNRGYGTPKPAPLGCMIENPDAFIVNYNGDLYKCPCFIGVKDYCVGHMDSGIKNYDRLYGLDIWKNNECLNCKYLPLCFGGCRHQTYMQTGKIDSVACQKDYLDASLETLVMQDITLRDT